MSRLVFLGYDREALDREYDNRRKVADSAAWLDRWARDSARARQELPCRLDVAYGPHPGETLDVFPAPGPGPAPVQVFIHGGYWHRLDKSDFSFVARAFRAAGAATVVVNYALIPAVDMDELVRQCRAAVAWVWQHAASFGGDPARIHVSGHSAGGHLIAMVMATEWERFGAPPGVVRSGAGLSGLYDLEPIRLCYLNDVLGLTAEAARRASPVHLPPPARGRLLLGVGALEGAEYHRQTRALADAWSTGGMELTVMELAGHHHFSIVSELADPTAGLSRAIVEMMDAA